MCAHALPLKTANECIGVSKLLSNHRTHMIRRRPIQKFTLSLNHTLL